VSGTKAKLARTLKDASNSWTKYAFRVLGKAGLCIIYMYLVFLSCEKYEFQNIWFANDDYSQYFINYI